MIRAAGIQLHKNGKAVYYDANGISVKPGDYVVVETGKGNELGQVILGCRDADPETLPTPILKIIRIATEEDIQRGTENRRKEQEAYIICQKKIAEHKLDMKLVSVEYTFDNSKILFYFTANGRVDFRSLVKDLASVFKMRIELRQIGVRDEAKLLGGLGPCGRPICCGTFLDDFQPVSIKMAKEQNLSLNPAKISGVCGRLMCCLKYEQDHYEKTRRRMPRVGREVSTPDGTGTVTDLNIVKETVFVRITNGDSSEIKEYALENISGKDGEGFCVKKETEKNRITEDQSSRMKDEKKPEKADEGEKTGEDKTVYDNRNNNASRERKNRMNHEKKRPERSGTESPLGKPVMRENPNRNENKKEDSATSAETPKNSSNWADALEKAMNAIH